MRQGLTVPGATVPPMHHTPPAPSKSDRPAVVLDTNVVLDWLVFDDASCARLAHQLQTGQLRWHATASMRNELSSVLPRRQFQRWSPDCERILSVFDTLALKCDEPPSAVDLMVKLRCHDQDDQKFIDLAVAVGAHLLFSKDRALLALARPAVAHGVRVLTPAQWQRQGTASLISG
jgi:putative PIN family toxin of toxin-antitoxin system